MRTSRLIGGVAAGCCLLSALSGCGDGPAGAAPATRAMKDAMAPAVDSADAVLPAPADLTLGAWQNAAQIPLPLGHSLAVTLDGNPSAGYVWDLDQVDTDVLRRDDEIVYTPAQAQEAAADAHGRQSAGGTFTARFTAVRPGATTLRLVYHRPFKADAAPKRIFTAHVMVAIPA